MTEIFNVYFFPILVIALLIGAVLHIIDLETRTGYRPSKDSARAMRQGVKLLKEANK